MRVWMALAVMIVGCVHAEPSAGLAWKLQEFGWADECLSHFRRGDGVGPLCTEYIQLLRDGVLLHHPSRRAAPREAPQVTQECCKICTTGQPCGDTCISRNYTCHIAGGCACWGY